MIQNIQNEYPIRLFKEAEYKLISERMDKKKEEGERQTYERLKAKYDNPPQ